MINQDRFQNMKMDQLFIMEWISMKNLIKRFGFLTTIFHPLNIPGARELESFYSLNNSQKGRIEWPDWKLQ